LKEGRINLYSDTQSRPPAAMREAIASALVGDEQSGQDPSVNQLCETVADLLGKEAAVFMPSGTMCNELAILVHCRPGDEVYAHQSAHIINFEGGGPAALAGVHIQPLVGERGIYAADTLRSAIRPESRYFPRARLVEVEQTANLGGGCVWSEMELSDVAGVAREHGLAVHMDGARLPNAAVAAGVPMRSFAQHADTVWIDLSKGLACPVGAVLAGSAEFIGEIWRWKQRVGGAMRQAGILAAAGNYALAHLYERLAQDHANAARFAQLITACEGVKLTTPGVETNIVFFDVEAIGASAPELSAALEARGINIGAFSDTVMRACAHIDVSAADVDEAAAVLIEEIEKRR
jgi:threonine aldolase